MLHLLQRLSSSTDQLEDEGSERITGETGIIMMCLLALGLSSLSFTNQTSEGLSPAPHAEGESCCCGGVSGVSGSASAFGF